MYRIFLIYVLLLIPVCLCGKEMNYGSFDNSLLSVEAHSVRCFLQDEQGFMWIGTNKGLFSYDGSRSFSHFAPGSSENCMIHCGLFYKNDFLLLGTERGILKYHIKFDRYVPFETDISKDIRTMALTANDLWLGCADGLFKYNFESKKLLKMSIGSDGDSTTFIINALLEDRGYMYVGASGHFGRFSLNDYTYEAFSNANGGWHLVTSLIKDNTRDCIWIGGGNSLTKYIPSSGLFENITGFPVVKTMGLDSDQNLVIGSDNGLYVYRFHETMHFVHNTQKPASLSNNIVWSVFRDRSDNIWLGTDFGFSIAPRHREFEYIPIFQFTGTGEGNQIYTLLRDSKGFYWLGGDNGLIRTRQLSSVDKDIRWYTMGDRNYYIPHNHIRDIFEDTGHHLWIATDFGVCRYDVSKDKFTSFLIRNEDGSKYANWAYNILEDDAGSIWVASFHGGLFKISKNRLAGNGFAVVADAHFSTINGLTSNNIDRIVTDKKGNIWALSYQKGLNVIHAATGVVTQFPIHDYTNGSVTNYMINDSDGNIWIGIRNGLVRIDPVTRKANTLLFSDADNALIHSLLQVGRSIMATSTEGLWMVNMDSFTVRNVSIPGKVFYSSCYDERLDEIILGGADEIALCSPILFETPKQSHDIIISSIVVNGKPYMNDDDELAVRYNNAIELPYGDYNITVEFSDLQYSGGNKGGAYVYRLNNDEELWTSLKAHENSIHLNNLASGKYLLTIAEKESGDVPVKVLKSFQIMIHPPWYFAHSALFIYVLIAAALFFWGSKFLRQKHYLKIARIERENALEQTRMKMDFFTNIAHEFKTPLSLIIAPLSKLILDKRNLHEKENLEMIHQNAMKLNALVQQAIDFYRDDYETPIGLVCSRVELVEFAQSILSSYEANMKERQIDFVFNSNLDKIFVDVDVLKIESIISNLLSNACKYTEPGGSVMLSLRYNTAHSMLEVRVSDSGVGIPEKDLPYVFQRFYQSPAHKERGGTGIGLYLVKSFTELHGGTVHVVSNTEEGTTFCVSLPIMIHDAAETSASEPMVHSESKEKPLLVIVEDNTTIARFIQSTFSDEFRCVVAHNGKTGLKLCTDLKPDIIIADIMMPVMNGLEMCQRLKANIQTSTIPVILLTAKDDRETELKSIHLNIDAFIPKPFEYNVLYSRVKQLLEARKQWERKMRIGELSTPVVEEVVSEDEKFLVGATRIIEAQMANPDFNVSLLCAQMNIPQKQIYRRIKSLTGLTPVDYIKSIRMKKAAILLSNRNFTVSEVMYKVGFSNHSYFAKCFHSEFGKNPSQFVE